MIKRKAVLDQTIPSSLAFGKGWLPRQLDLKLGKGLDLGVVVGERHNPLKAPRSLVLESLLHHCGMYENSQEEGNNKQTGIISIYVHLKFRERL